MVVDVVVEFVVNVVVVDAVVEPMVDWVEEGIEIGVVVDVVDVGMTEGTDIEFGLFKIKLSNWTLVIQVLLVLLPTHNTSVFVSRANI